MAKLGKQVRKDVKKMSKQLFSKKGLTLKQTYDISTSFYANKKENKPYVTITAHGDYKISVLKLIVILMCILSSVMVIVLCIRGLFERIKSKKRYYFDEDEYYYSKQDDDLPF